MAFTTDLLILLEPFTESKLLKNTLTDSSNEERMEYLAVLDALSALVVKRQDEIRNHILSSNADKEWAQKYETGSVTRGIRVSKSPDLKQVLAFLEEHEIDPKQYLDQSIQHSLNPSKIQELINRGVLPEDTFTRFTESKPTFTIRLSKRVKSDLYSTLGITDTTEQET